MGNTIRELVPEWMASVHPHGRGEHFKEPSPEKIASGSSPRAWGTPISLQAVKQCIRFIPTGVGNTIHKDLRDHIAAVHPHGRGEHINSTAAKLKPIGSSPRAWGTRNAANINPCKSRFIPTGVGNTIPKESKIWHIAVHPHGRGEHKTGCRIIRIPNGSSPRAWGTLILSSIAGILTRFIPTGVGNTKCRSLIFMPSSVHPHGRGEHFSAHCKHFLLSGSSPRAWGTHIEFNHFRSISRFIPTGVGNTVIMSTKQPSSAVHPHGRGEHSD